MKKCTVCGAFLKKDNEIGLCPTHEAEMLRAKVAELEAKINKTPQKRGRKPVNNSVHSIAETLEKVFQNGDTAEARQALKDWFDAEENTKKAINSLKEVKKIAIEMGLVPAPGKRGRKATKVKQVKQVDIIPAELDGLEVGKNGKVNTVAVYNHLCKNADQKTVNDLFIHFYDLTKQVVEKYGSLQVKQIAVDLGFVDIDCTPKKRGRKAKVA